jgi:oxygen-dependent protoporphyrinogen oxidase
MAVVVAGGGITGLAAAWELARAGIAVELYEASDRIGGKIRTERVDGFLVEDGPDSFISYRPAATALARELGLGGEIIGTTNPRVVHIRTGGRFVPLPEGIGLVLPTRMRPFVTTRLFSPLEKLAMARDLLLPRTPAAEEVSIGGFLRRRLGAALVERLADPLIGGIYGASVDELSLDAVLPQLRAAERDHRSLLLASLAQGRNRARAVAAGSALTGSTAGARTTAGAGSPFLSLRDGMGSLIDRLAARLAQDSNVRIRLGLGVAEVWRSNGALAVRLTDGATVRADAVVLAGPARASASALAHLAPATATALNGVQHGSTAVVSLGYRADQLAGPSGHGFLVARDEPLAFGACTWSSSKWASRAPDGMVLARAFLGERSPALLGRPDDEVAATIHADLARVAGIWGTPVMSRVARWTNAMPRYTIGHLGRVAALEEALRAVPNVAVAGAAVRGVGVPDCVEQGRTAARRIAAALAGTVTAAA